MLSTVLGSIELESWTSISAVEGAHVLLRELKNSPSPLFGDQTMHLQAPPKFCRLLSSDGKYLPLCQRHSRQPYLPFSAIIVASALSSRAASPPSCSTTLCTLMAARAKVRMPGTIGDEEVRGLYSHDKCSALDWNRFTILGLTPNEIALFDAIWCCTEVSPRI